MFIKRVEIFGFKSFKNKTVLEFSNQDITGIVGPNGCGKSNVVDALLWVMGESSPKSLRGEALSDIIFGGTRKEEPGNVVEVNLILGKGSFGFPPDYNKFSEVMITRKAYRDGKNEYFINNQTCLLREVREFFMNTGAGCRGFSIIEQESIEKLITAKPRERRFIIEEVAGIAKFKSRKQESERKLLLVNQNLQRLDDILKMQESQLNKLTIQAKQAKKYRDLKQQIQTRQMQIEKTDKESTFRSYELLGEEQKTIKAEKQKKEQSVQMLTKNISVAKDSLNTIKKQEVEKRTHLEVIRKREMEQGVNIQSLKMIESVKAKKEAVMESIKVTKEDMIKSIKAKKEALKIKEAEIQEELKPVRDFFKNNVPLSELEKEAEQVHSHLAEIKNNKKELELKVGVSAEQGQFIEREINHLSEENKLIQTQIQKNMKEKNKIYSFLEKQKQMNLKFGEELERIVKNEAKFKDQKENLESVKAQLSQGISLLECKIEEMKKLISRFENINEGAAELIKWKPEDFQSLFQSLKVEPEYAEALGSVLGYHVQALVPKEDVCLEQGIQRLKTLKNGRVSFVSSLPGALESSVLKTKLKSYPAVICFLDEKVSLNIYTESLRFLLGQTVVASDLNAAFELKRQFPAFQFVTKEGDFITRESLVYAGSGGKETSLFKIRNQIEDLSKDLSSKKVEQKVKKLELDSCIKRWKHIRQQEKDVRNQNRDNFEKMIAFRKDIERIEKDIVRLLDDRKKNDEKVENYNKEKQNLLKHEEAYNQELKSFDEVISVKETQFQSLSSGIEDHKNYNIKKVKWEKELLENRKDQQSLDQEVSLLSDLVHKTQSSAKEEQTSEKANLSLQEEIELIDKERQKLIWEIKNCEEELQQHSQVQTEREKNISELEEKLIQTKMGINNLTLSLDKKEFERGHLKSKFLDLYKVQIENFVSSDSSLENVDVEVLQKEKESYQKRLDSMEGINFLALEEYEKLSKENLFLNSQKEDLVKSRKEIVKVIAHIDKLCETRFQDMLVEINKRFSKVFPIVFQGDNAKAELVLHEDADSQEPGIDILIHPPGKRPQSVTLLSRGEKALTSICLIYSLFLVKPSPFCIIDEADAPLDDANIFRFISVLKEMSRKSQIITITHNKYTMQACKKLYGVTMERPGISQIVSVDMDSTEIPQVEKDLIN